jgi:hypothetical protein
LALVLVGDIFSVGGAIPVPISQDTAQTASSEVVLAPANASDEVSAEITTFEEPAAGGYTEPETKAVPEEEAMMQAAAVEEPEAVVVEEIEPISGVETEIIVSDAVAEDATETPQGDREAERMAEGTTVVLPASETDAVSMDATEQPQEMAEDEEGEVDVHPVEEPTACIPTATLSQIDQSTVAQPADMTLTENAEPPPAEKAPPVAPRPELATSEPEPTDIVSVTTEAVAAEVRTREEPSDVLLGAEAILALLAVGLGIAWLYLHRRGG